MAILPGLLGAISNDGVGVPVIVPPAPPSPPNCLNDITETLAETPVTISPLSNDIAGTNPIDASSLTITISPLSGIAELGPNEGEITYTPNEDFSGSDVFTYTVADTSGLVTGSATITVNVTEPPAPISFANGYSRRFRIRVPAENVSGGGSMPNYLMYVDVTHNDLKLIGNGGVVNHASGWDIRFESPADAKLPHHIVSYDGTVGNVKAFIRVTVNGASDTTRYLYIGKSGLTATEEQINTVYAGYWAVINGRTGVDYTGNGRNFTPTDVGAATLLGDAGDYNGTTSLMQAALTGWDGSASFTAQILAQLDADAIGDNRGYFKQGPQGTQAGTNMGFALYTRPTDAGETVDNPLLANVGCTTTNGFIVGGNEEQTSNPEWLTVTWADGLSPTIRKAGIALGLSNSQAGVGNTQQKPAGTPANWYIGDGPSTAQFPKDGTFKGLIATIRLIQGTVISANQQTTEARNYLDTEMFYGISDSDPPNVNQSPIAIPFYAECLEDASVTIDVLSKAFDPDGDTITISDAGTPSHGECEIVTGKIKYTPTSSYFGEDEFIYTISDGNSNFSSAKVKVHIIEVDVEPVDGPYNFEFGLPWELPESNDDIVFFNMPHNLNATSVNNFPIGDETTMNKVLVVVPPATGMTTGRFNFDGLGYGGFIWLGAEWNRTGPELRNGPTHLPNPQRKGGNFFNIGHRNDAQTLMTGDRRPYIFRANEKITMVDSWWGDIFRGGTPIGNGTPPNNMDSYFDYFCQKLHMVNGHLCWDAVGNPTSTHSDFCQIPKGGANNIHICDCDITMEGLGCYTLDSGAIDNAPTKTWSPQGARLYLHRISYQRQPDPFGITNGAFQVHTAMRQTNSNPADGAHPLWVLNNGMWRAMFVKDVIHYIPNGMGKWNDAAAGWRTPYCPPDNLTVGGRKFAVWTPPASPAGRLNGDQLVMEDKQAELVNDVNQLPLRVPPAHCGAACRITDVGTLRSVFGGG